MKEPEQKSYLQHLQRAEALLEIGRWRGAIHEFDLHLAKYPGDYTALCKASSAHAELGELQNALDRSKEAIRSRPESDWAYRLQGIIFATNGEHQRALEAAEKAAQFAPESAIVLLSLTYAQANYGKLDDAQTTLAALLKAAPDTQESHEAAGYVALKRESLAEAEESFLAALAINPESVNALNNLGVVYQRRARKGEREYHDKATEMFERALKVNPSFKLAENNRKINLTPSASTVGAPIGLIIGLMILLSSLSRRLGSMAQADSFTILRILDNFNPIVPNAFFTFLNFYAILIFLSPVALVLRKALASLGVKFFVANQKGSWSGHWSDRWFLMAVLLVLSPLILFYLAGVYGAGWEGSPFGWLALTVESIAAVAFILRLLVVIYKVESEKEIYRS